MISGISNSNSTAISLSSVFEEEDTEAPSLTHTKFRMEFTVFIALLSILCLIIFIYTITYGLRLFNTKPKHTEDVEAIQARKNIEF